jgi:hypothetical protein
MKVPQVIVVRKTTFRVRTARKRGIRIKRPN